MPPHPPRNRADRPAPLNDGPRRIGRYPILERLGMGGMGVVYAAYDDQLDRRIAIKLIRRSGSSNLAARVRIRREALAMARLSHPAVVHVYEVDEWQGQTYVAMEYVRGQTLRQWLKTPRPLEQRLGILTQAARGLAAAHRAGVVHRDFKPDNMMVDVHGRVRVLDFGLARANGADSIERSLDGLVPSVVTKPNDLRIEVTRAGAVLGTPAYMSPEQHRGVPTGPSSDQYSFCAVAYEALYGVRPFTGPNRIAIALAIHRGLACPPPEGHGVPPALHQVLVRGLAPDPRDRWPSMEDLVDAMEAARGIHRRRILPTVLAGTAALLLAVLTMMLWWRPTTAAAAPDYVQTLVHKANAAAARARWVYPNADKIYDTALFWASEVAQQDQERAQQLRQEMGAALVGLGDSLWHHDGGRLLAREFYLQAVLFDGSLSEARRRSGFTNVEIADLRARALAGELTAPEIEAGDDLAFLVATVVNAPASISDEEVVQRLIATAQSNRTKRAKRSTRSLEHDPDPSTDEADDDDDLVLDPDPSTDEADDDDDLVLDPDPSTDEADDDDDLVLDPDAVDPARAAKKRARRRRKARARSLVAEGNEFRRAGQVDAAEQRYRSALRLAPRNGHAYDGLQRLRFNAGRFADAVRYAEKAVRCQPRNARYRRHLGDAYYKTGRLMDARRAYTKGAKLGDDKARERLKKVS
ncbi:MAG: protein kinase [Myxococcota bacterium]